MWQNNTTKFNLYDVSWSVCTMNRECFICSIISPKMCNVDIDFTNKKQNYISQEKFKICLSCFEILKLMYPEFEEFKKSGSFNNDYGTFVTPINIGNTIIKMASREPLIGEDRRKYE